MSKKPKKDGSKIRKFWNWLGKQNVFLVFIVFFLVVYGSTKAYAHFFNDPVLSEKSIGPSVKTTVTPQATISPAAKKDDLNSNYFKYPSAKPTAAPTIEKDPIIDCKRPDDCGGETVRVKQSECFSKVCCPADNDHFEILTYDECYEKQVEFSKKQNEEYQKKLDEEYQKYLDAYNRNTEEKQDQYNKELTEYKNQLLEQCRSNAQATYKQKPIGSTTNNNTGAYVVGESQLVREQLNKALQACNDLYGQ